MSAARQGRPKASSRETLAEAAAELFLEQGYDATSVSEITARAGVSRSSFFNYFASKHDVLWAGVDEAIDRVVSTLSTGELRGGAGVVAALTEFAADLAPDSLALAFANAEAMGAVEDLRREADSRAARIADAVASTLREGGATALRSRVLGAAYGHAVIAALQQWSLDGSGRTPLSGRMAEALSYVGELPAH